MKHIYVRNPNGVPRDYIRAAIVHLPNVPEKDAGGLSEMFYILCKRLV